MSYFNCLNAAEKSKIFFLPPASTLSNTGREVLACALGAVLYMPASSPEIFNKLFKKKIAGLITTVLCLEDAIGDQQVASAEQNLVKQLTALQKVKKLNQPPFIFVRVRNGAQLKRLVKTLGAALPVLTGFVFPKFEPSTGWQYFEELKRVNQFLEQPLYGMPILESAGIIQLETRSADLLQIKTVLDIYKDLVLNIRIGATDLSGYYGIRRSSEFTIYDIALIKDCIAAIINVFGRCPDDYVISSPVWEYFSPGHRVLKPQLRKSPFQEHYGKPGLQLRHQLICSHLDGLIKEVLLDKANGLIGKTIIHPSHLAPVQALYAVTHEEYADATDILQNGNGGVLKSAYNNKMNEVKPHINWAQKIITMSKIYGVLKENYDYTSIIYAKKEL